MSVCFGGDKLLERRSVLLENVSLVTVNALQHDERFFADPEPYDPDRFAPGRRGAFHVMRICRFAAVPRYALAMPSRMVEARLILATVAERYRL
jgi:cytochrome P450